MSDCLGELALLTDQGELGTEMALTQTFEKALAPQIEIQEGKDHE
jgi:hypothetical protein